MSRQLMFVSLFVSLAWAGSASAQEGSTPPPASPPAVQSPADAPPSQPRFMNSITLAVVPVFSRTLAVEYERAVNDSVSLFIAPRVQTTSVTMTDADAVRSYDLNAIGGELGARFFLVNAHAPSSLFVSPTALVTYSQGTLAGQQGSSVRMVLTGQVGYTWLAGNFDFSLGAGILGGVALGNGDPRVFENGLQTGWLARLNLGWAF